ncbi:MAG: D-glycero-beta-D-manno-heptose-7-phosphate kinase [Aquifex sp.]|nr:MAG: D-glycero-beta-D-manno-heptose-7-phosphate kinase [Aquifex sp.]
MVSLQRVQRLLEKLKSLKILVIGDVILDTYLKGKVERISPEAPVPILEVEEEEFRLGGAGNVARNLSSLGVETFICSVIGKDEAGEKIKQLLEESRIKAFLVEDKRPTTKKTRVVSRNQQLLRIDWEDKRKISGETLKNILRIIRELEVDAIIVSDYAKGVITKEVMDEIKKSGVFFSIDPRPKNKELYKKGNLMTPNEKELIEMSNGKSGNVETLGKILKEELKLDTLIVTRGPKGMTLFIDKEIKHFPAKARKVYDVTGAGDTVIASITAFKLAGASWEECCEIGNLCAGIVVGEFGTASVTPEKLIQEIKFYEQTKS